MEEKKSGISSMVGEVQPPVTAASFDTVLNGTSTSASEFHRSCQRRHQRCRC